MLSLGTWQYDDDTAEAAVKLALQTGFNHIDTANAGTKQLLDEDISQLGLDYVDMMLLHSPARSCSAMQDQWRAMEDFQAAGKTKSIGVSNYCQSSFDCLSKTWKVKPAINQIELHVGMG